MRVERCTAINPDAPVANIYIDDEGTKWVSNTEGLWEVHAADLATPVIVGSAEECLLQFPGGNADIRWQKGQINDLIGGSLTGSNTITAAYYNEVMDQLWVGTAESGVYLFRTEGKLRWIKEISRRLPKLRSQTINTIYVNGDEDRHFIGTDQGIIVGRDNRWGLEERYFRFQAVTHRGSSVWLLAEDLIWVVDKDDHWRSVEIDPEQVQGAIKDIAFDREGKLWIASEFLTVFDPDANRYKVFDGADYFTSNDVNCLAVDRDGAVWVGTQDKGLFVIEKESAMTVTCLEENPVSCDPMINDGSLIVKIKGGQPPYTFAWEGGLTGENPKDLAPGIYTLTVTDSRGQSKPAQGEITDTRLRVEVTQNRPHNDEAKGSATASIEGGKPKYTYQWDNGENGPTADRLEAGSHSVTITDVNGCKVIGEIEITREAADLSAEIVAIATGDCADGKNAAELKIRGGIEPYTIQWNDANLSGEKIEGLEAGTYMATVTDAASNSVDASINFKAAEPIIARASQLKAANMEGLKGSGHVDVSGGAGKYKYQWDNGETKARAQNLSAGIHSVTVTDQNGCTTTTTVDISQEVAELAVSLEITSKSKCAGDGANEIRAKVLGGEGPYVYKWHDASLEGQDLKGIEGGIYYLTVTDQRGEAVTTSVNVPSLVQLEIEATVHAEATANNEDGRASVKATGGTGKYSYAWSNGEKGKDATKLAPGHHTVTVSDEVGCSETTSVEISENISEMSVVINQDSEVKCHGESSASIEAVVRGGKSPFEFNWSDASLSGENPTRLGKGRYAVTVTDAAGNTSNASLDIDEPDSLGVEIAEVRGVTDAASADGKAEVVVSGGTAPYEYMWDNDHTGDKVTNMSLGTHHVTVTDANGCSAVAEFEIKEKLLPQLSLNSLRSGQVVQMQRLQFDADSTNINESAEPILNEVYDFLKDNPGVVIRVEGHTNNVPPDEFCDKLSTARAKSVAEYIVKQGVAGERVYYRGYGKRQPLYDNRTADGRRKNQRVEIKILEINRAGP